MYIYFKIENKHGKDKYQVLDRTGLAKVCLGFSGTLYKQKFGQSNNCFQCWAGWEGWKMWFISFLNNNKI